MRLLITGSRGFVGGSLARCAARAGHEVLGIGRSSQPEANWPGKYLQADVAHTDLSVVIRDFVPDVLFHAAGTASVGASLSAPLDDLRASILTWANALDCIRRSGLKPLVLFPSSAAVYGNPANLPVREDEPSNPISPYGFHKTTCELLAREYAECFGLDIIVCRLFSIFGKAQRRLLIWELYKQLADPDRTIWLQGIGTESRDYLHIEDVAVALFQLIDNRHQRQNPGQYLVVNVARGEGTQVLELAQQLRDLIAPEKSIRCRGLKRPGDPHHWCADISFLRSLVPSWQPTPLSLTLSRCVDAWHKERHSFPYEDTAPNRHC